MIMEQVIYWLTSITALVGVWLNIRKNVACFWIWSFTNAIWVYADIAHGLYAQAALMSVYFLLAIYGISRWREEGRGDAVKHQAGPAAGPP